MRLINATTLKLEEFLGKNIPSYAILSHTWGPEEVSLRDFQAVVANFDDSALLPKTSGWGKILHACEETIKLGWEFLWVDTCCIDKSSSAELTEAINSMFQWYSDSQVCLAHLEDFTFENTQRKSVKIGHCRWFTRGWCLQELLAPGKLLFFDTAWAFVAEKHEIVGSLARFTKIDKEVLTGQTALMEVSIACRLSWAATRETTRVEDQAYCLLGILGINMPLLYGEGYRAFQRLQHLVLQTHDDPSIFAWHDTTSTELYQEMLAPSLNCFADCGNIRCRESSEPLTRIFSHTSRGIRVTSPNLHLLGNQDPGELRIYVLILGGVYAVSDKHGSIMLSLTKVRPGGYMRLNKPFAQLSLPVYVDPLGSDEDIHILPATAWSGLSLPGTPSSTKFMQVECSGQLWPLWSAAHQEVEPRASWDSANSRFFLDYYHTPLAYIKLYPEVNPDKPRSVWFVLALKVRLDSASEAADWLTYVASYLIPSKVWESLEGLRNVQVLVTRAIQHKDSVLVSGYPETRLHEVGSLRVQVTQDTESIRLHCSSSRELIENDIE